MTPASGFVDFCGRVLGVRLTPAQRVLAAVAFDGIDPAELRGADREIAAQLFGDVDTIPAEARHVVAIVKGARVGGSYIFGALRLLHLALVVPLDMLAPGEVAAALIVAPDLRLARQTLRFALGAALRVPSIARRVSSDTSDGFLLSRPGGLVSVECLPASRGGSAVRGRSLVGAVMDEAAFFYSDGHVVNDAEVYRALAPRVVAGGQLIVDSTPWAEAGLLFDLFSENHGKPSSALAARAPTLLMRTDDPRVVAYVRREELRDADNAAREFDCQFMSAGSERFFDADTIDEAVEIGRVARVAGPVSAGADFAFVRDHAAAIVVARDGDRIGVVEVDEVRPQRAAKLVPSVVAMRFGRMARRLGASVVAADGHYSESVREHLTAVGVDLRLAPPGQDGKAATYLATRDLLRTGRLMLPDHARLVAQLKAVVAKPTPGGGLSITSPRRSGAGHGDLVSALVLAVWSAARDQLQPSREGRIYVLDGSERDGGDDDDHERPRRPNYWERQRHGWHD